MKNIHFLIKIRVRPIVISKHFSQRFYMIIKEPGVLPDSRIYIYEPSAFARKALMQVPIFGNYQCVEPYQIDRSNWDYLLLLHIDSGALELAYLDQQIRLTAGCLYLIDCRIHHVYRAIGSLHFRWFHITGGCSQAFYEALVNQAANGLDTRQHPAIANTLNRFDQQLLLHPPNELQVNLLLTELLTSMLLIAEGETRIGNSSIINVHQQILEGYSDDLHLSDLAQSVNLSVCHLARQYRRHYGVPPHEQLIILRISAAKKQLLTTDMPVENIAAQCGFNSTSHFIRAFSQRVGQTPGQFRKQRF